MISTDPMWYKYPHLSPYAYCGNNPIQYIDPDGRFTVWAVAGAAVDYGFQVYGNYKKGNTGYDAWVGNVDFVDVTLSAVNPAGKFKVLKTVAVEATKAAINVTPEKGVKVEEDATKIVKETLINTTINVGVGKVVDTSSTKSLQKSTKEVEVANRQLRTATRQAEKAPNSPLKAAAVNDAKINVYKANKQLVFYRMLNSTIGTIPNITEQLAPKVLEIIIKGNEK